MSVEGRGAVVSEGQPQTPSEPSQVREIRELRPPDLEDRGPMDPGQYFTRHLAVATSGAAAALPPQPLGFRARCVVVDNFTNQYIYIPDGNTWVPPYVVGYRVLIYPTDKSQATMDLTANAARGTVTQVAPVSAEIAVLTWCEKVILSVPLSISVATRTAP